MEDHQSVDFAKIILKEELPQPTPALHIQPQTNLSYEHNPHSLALGIQHSIQNGIPIPRNMLSHSDDMPLHEEDFQREEGAFNKVKIQPTEEDQQWLQEQLGLNEMLYLKKGPNNTKNVLRNFGNAQNQYILYNQEAITYANQQLAVPQRFFNWVRTLRLEKFQHFKDVWSDQHINPVFQRVYRELCFKFYQDCAIPYVLSSRMKNQSTKLSHLRYIYRFVQGLKDPYQFTYFKKQNG